MSTDVYTIVTQRVIALLEAGVAPWHKTWRGGDAPRNLVSHQPYRGINMLLLSTTSFSSPYWLTFNQVQQLGGRVRKAAKSELVIFWKLFEASNENDVETGTPRAGKRPPMLRYYRVFNVEQTAGLEQRIPEQTAAEATFTPIETAARIIERMPQRPPIRHDKPQAFYSPRSDYVNLPQPEAFDTPEHYYAVAFHELTHATGHASRLNRAGVANSSALAPFGSGDYSREELVAELGSAFLCAAAGIVNATLDNSAAYLQSWLDVLKADARLIVTAASAAQRAADFIMGHSTPHDADIGEGTRS